MNFCIYFLVFLTLASIPCDAQDIGEFLPFESMRAFGGMGMGGFDMGGMGIEEMGMGGLDKGGMGMGGMDMGGMGMGGLDMGEMGIEEMGMGDMGMGKGNMGQIADNAPLIPTEEEEKMCEDKATELGRKLKKVMKFPKKTCEVTCMMDKGQAKLMSPPETKCCDIGGIAATGECNENGKCVMFMI